MEVEEDNCIAYLDTKLYHMGHNIRFDWYSKDTSSGRIINFNTTQPKAQIINTAKSLIYRILTISDEEFHDKNERLIMNILMNNSFPRKHILSLVDEMKRKIGQRDRIITTGVTEPRAFFSVKFIPNLMDNKTLKTIKTNDNTYFAFKPNTTLNTIFSKTKAPIEQQQQNNIVYEIPCKGDKNENCTLVYIGTTKRSLQTRMTEHKTDIEKEKARTALSQHIIDTGHTADFDGVKILDKERRERTRMTLESLRIQEKITKTMNHKEDSDNISASYSVAITKKTVIINLSYVYFVFMC